MQERGFSPSGGCGFRVGGTRRFVLRCLYVVLPVPPHFFGLAQRNGVEPQRKTRMCHADVHGGALDADREARPGCSGPGKPLTGAAPSTARSAWHPTGGGGPDRGGKATVPKRGPAPPSPLFNSAGPSSAGTGAERRAPRNIGAKAARADAQSTARAGHGESLRRAAARAAFAEQRAGRGGPL